MFVFFNSMTSTSTRTNILFHASLLLDVGVLVGVVVREHNNYPKCYCESRAGVINRGR